VPANDAEEIDGMPVTRPLRTILDLLQEGLVSEDLLVQALRQGVQRGLITRKAIRDTSLPEELGRQFRRIVERAV
jgi:hypothetical protein